MEYSKPVGDRVTNSTAIEAIQTLLGVLCYRPLSGNECIQGLCKLSAGLLLASAQQSQISSGPILLPPASLPAVLTDIYASFI